MSFCQYFVLGEMFNLNDGCVLTLESSNPEKTAKKRIAKVFKNYSPAPNGVDHLAAAVAGLKPCSLIQYSHHPENPAADFVIDSLKKNPTNLGAVQAKLLQYGFKIRPDFSIVHINLPNYMTSWIAVGGKKQCEELKSLYECQYYLDNISAVGNKDMQIKCKSYCTMGNAGMNCKPIHKRIGELLGYTEDQINHWLHQTNGYNHIPDLEYPFELPKSLNSVPRKIGYQ